MSTSTAPATLTAFVAQLQAAPALDGVDVHDGPPLTGESEDYICVGHDPLTAESVEFTQVPGPLSAGRKRNETYDILCSLVSWSGDGTFATHRDRAYVLLGAVEDVLRDDVTISGTVRTAQLTGGTLLQEATNRGVAVGIRFRVSCEARI